MKDALLYILKSIVEDTDSLSVDENDDNGFVTLVIHANPSEIGKIIGKNGKIIRSIRNVIKIKAIKENKKIQISIAETNPQI